MSRDSLMVLPPARFFLNQTRNAKQILPAFTPWHFRPDIFVSVSRCFHGEIDVLFVGATDLRQFLFRSRINRVEIVARLRRDKFPANEQLIAVVQLDVAVRFWRRRVTPAFTEVETSISFCNRPFSTLAVPGKDRQLDWFPPRHKLRQRKIICALVAGVDHFYQLHEDIV